MTTICPCCKKSVEAIQFGYCEPCGEAMDAAMPPDRVVKAWEGRSGFVGLPRTTEAEWDAIRGVWRRIPEGSSCWMTAYSHMLRRSRDIFAAGAQ